uniref:Uncharacterized protein n=1 Tax=Zea mays TaxID=4577 RepID=A0A804LE43_MAIZE
MAVARISPSPPRPSPSSDGRRLRGHGEFGVVRASTETSVIEILGIKMGCISPVSHLFELGKVFPEGHKVEFMEIDAGDLVVFPTGLSCT